MIIDRKNRREILMNLFKEGVMVVEKNPFKAQHSEELQVRNLECMSVCKSLTSKGYLMEKFNWQWHYYFLTNEGIEFLREQLGLPADVIPATLKKQTPQRTPGGGKGKGERGGDGKGWGRLAGGRGDHGGGRGVD